jgi:uncharacterized zinc-type alcohol dehydrogenase-like protein
MISSQGYAALSANTSLVPFSFKRKSPSANEVHIQILYCGICHSDVHQAKNEWNNGYYPMVPGHEIVGKVLSVGSQVKKFKTGDHVGVGCLIGSCRTCSSCHEGDEQYCEKGWVGTYNSLNQETGLPSYGGYSDNIMVHEDFVLRISPNQNLSAVAPLLCAGITTYSPLRHWNVKPGHKVGIVGLGGLGHMAVKLAHSFGAHVVVFSTSTKKKEDALRLGAHQFIVSNKQEEMNAHLGSFDFILNTVSAPHDINQYLHLLKKDGSMVLLGIPDQAPLLEAFPLILKRRKIAGSLIGGIRETQEMLDYCAKHNITSDVEVIPIQQINQAYERMMKGDVKFRFVIDLKSLKV